MYVGRLDSSNKVITTAPFTVQCDVQSSSSSVTQVPGGYGSAENHKKQIKSTIMKSIVHRYMQRGPLRLATATFLTVTFR